jgi:hypothetical protein
MTVALIYNWWSLFVRLANLSAEAITSRPFLLCAVARKTHPAGQDHLRITSQYAKADRARTLLTRVNRLLHQWNRAAEQLASPSVWQQACKHLAVTGSNWLAPLQAGLLPAPDTG